MKLEYTYSFAEYKAINIARQRRVKFVRLRNWLFWGLVVANAAVSLGYIYTFAQGQASFSWLIFANLTIAVAFVAYRYVFLPYWVHRYYNMQMLEGKKIQVHLLENGIETVTDNAASQYSWQGFIGANEAPEHFVIWVNKMQALCIPKRAFKHDEQMGDFRKIIAKNVENQELQA